MEMLFYVASILLNGSNPKWDVSLYFSNMILSYPENL